MRFSVAIPTCTEGLSFPLPFASAQDVVRIVQAAERLGFHAVWGNDHITAPVYVREEQGRSPRFYEPLISLSYAAAVTSRIRLGTCVIVLPMREPVYLAKQAITLDVMSRGRLLFGVGVGAYREEFEAIHPDLKGSDRGKIVDESIEALRMLFDQPRASFQGKFYRFEGIELYPKAVQTPMPIYVGGNNPNQVKRTARWGQGWLPASLGVEDLRKGVEMLRRECEAAGRDPSTIDVAPQIMVVMGKDEAEVERRFKNSQMYRHLISLGSSTLRNQQVERLQEYNLIGTPQQIIDKIGRLAEAGVTHCAAMNFISDTPDGMIEGLQAFAEEVMPAFAG